MARSDRGATDTGIVLHEKMPVPKGRESEPRMPRRPSGKIATRLPLVIGGVALAAGVLLGFCVRPAIAPDKRIGAAETQAAEAQAATATQKERADRLDKQLAAATTAKALAEKQVAEATKAQAELATKLADTEAKAKDVGAVQTKLRAAIDKATGTVSTEGDEVHVQISDKVLFKPGDDQLTDRGKQVIAKISGALKDLPDKQVWVQGHTDDQPVPTPPAPKRPAKGAPAVPPTPPRFATNWELSAARALTVVHYMQDTAKLEPARLAALAFSQYRPISRANKAANRRIEIVLSPKSSTPSK